MHPIENMMKTAMEQIKEMVDVNTIVGDAIFSQDGTVILPVSRVGFGFVAGGGEYPVETKSRLGREEIGLQSYPFAGGAGAGISIKPIAFVVVSNGTVRLLPIENTCTMDRILEIVPQAFELVRDFLDKWLGDSYPETEVSEAEGYTEVTYSTE
ncbi:GerW family sporulation protein [Eubacteriales bacterium OttesenSCG-928-M02]|nr:GerW family sporulation protein [Eubacteriales bacterium OttesenSCG-928-M02]